MKILILVSAAENYPPFFVKMGNYLEKSGHEVCFAFESHLADYLYPHSRPDSRFKCFYFSDFFRDAKDNLKPPPSHMNDQLWQALFSDFERFSIFGLHKDKPRSYFERLLTALTNFFDDLLREQKIDAVIFETVSNAFAHVCFLVAQRLGKKFLGVSSSRLPGRFEIQETIYDVGHPIQKTYEKLLANGSTALSPEMVSYLRDFDTSEPDYMVNNLLSPTRSLIGQYISLDRFRYLYRILNYTVKCKSEIYYVHQMGNPLTFSLKMLMRALKRRLKLIQLPKFFDEISENESYYLYPIQFHPESSTSVLAPNYIDEYNTIRSIAFALPFGTYLYVKDHKSSAGYPSLQLYEGLRKIPNVKLIHYNANTKALIKRSKGVITSTSTVGYEALLLDIPVFLLGRVFYEFHPMCRRVSSISELSKILLEPNPHLDSTLIKEAFLEAYFKHTFEGTLVFNSDGGLKGVYENIANYLDTMKAVH